MHSHSTGDHTPISAQEYLVDVADTLAEVKVGIARRGDALDLQQGGAHLLDVARALVAHKHRLGVQADVQSEETLIVQRDGAVSFSGGSRWWRKMAQVEQK